MIFPKIVCRGEWDDSIVRILEKELPNQEYVLIDIGANVGLFSRQVSNSDIKITSIYCVEPDEENYLMLEQNLAEITEPYYLHKYAVDDVAGEKVLYEDINNAGNYSLNKNAMANASIEKKIETVTVKDFFNNLNLKPNQKLIIKTDTQGMDEKIISLIPDKVWDMVACAVIEVWDIEKEKFDYQKFEEKIEMFRYRKFDDNPCVTGGEIKKFTSNNSRQYKDLILIR